MYTYLFVSYNLYTIKLYLAPAPWKPNEMRNAKKKFANHNVEYKS